MVLFPLLALGALGLVGANWYFLRQLRQYQPVTMEMPYTEANLIDEYALGDRRTPADFGVEVWQEVEQRSLADDLTLRGWLLPPPDTASTQAIVFVHGRWSNRLKPMGYLPLLRELGVDQTHHILLPDLRNSGLSDPGPTAMGYHFAEDLAAWLAHLHDAHGIERVTLYGFSMGAMASAVMLHRPELTAELDTRGVVVDRIIMDSPLSNVDANIRYSATARQGTPDWLTSVALVSFNRAIDGFLPSMRLSVLANGTPWLILHGELDRTTPAHLLRQELDLLGEQPHIQAHIFPDARHVKIHRMPEHQDTYTRLVADFLGAELAGTPTAVSEAALP